MGDAIHVDAGASCLDADTLLRRVARWLGRERVEEHIRVDVHGGDRVPSEPWFAIERGAEHERAERRLRDAPVDCDQLHSALALSIALAIDAALSEEDGAGPAPAFDTDEEPEAPEAPAQAPYFRVAIAALGQAASNLVTFSGIAPAATLRVELGFVRWLDLRAGAVGARLGGQELAPGEGDFAADLVAGRLEVCPVLALPQLRVLACADGMIGSFRTTGQHFSGESFVQAEPFYALGGSLELQAEVLSWLGFAASVEFVVPLQQRTVVLLGPDAEIAYEQQLDALGLLIGAGPVFRFF